MRIRRLVLVLSLPAFWFALAPLALSQPMKDPLPADDKQLLQGKWEVTSVSEDGKEAPPKGRVTFIFRDDRLKVMLDNKVTNDMTYALGPSRKIDLFDKWSTAAKDKQDRSMLGIYKFTTADKRIDDKLALCLVRQTSYKEKPKGKEAEVPVVRETERPTDFTSTKEKGVILLKRVKMEPGDWFEVRDDDKGAKTKP